jgi:hypothetical protein
LRAAFTAVIGARRVQFPAVGGAQSSPPDGTPIVGETLTAERAASVSHVDLLVGWSEAADA